MKISSVMKLAVMIGGIALLGRVFVWPAFDAERLQLQMLEFPHYEAVARELLRKWPETAEVPKVETSVDLEGMNWHGLTKKPPLRALVANNSMLVRFSGGHQRAIALRLDRTKDLLRLNVEIDGSDTEVWTFRGNK